MKRRTVTCRVCDERFIPYGRPSSQYCPFCGSPVVPKSKRRENTIAKKRLLIILATALSINLIGIILILRNFWPASFLIPIDLTLSYLFLFRKKKFQTKPDMISGYTFLALGLLAVTITRFTH